jgi:hypothetical protein
MNQLFRKGGFIPGRVWRQEIKPTVDGPGRSSKTCVLIDKGNSMDSVSKIGSVARGYRLDKSETLFSTANIFSEFLR